MGNFLKLYKESLQYSNARIMTNISHSINHIFLIVIEVIKADTGREKEVNIA